MAEDMSIRIEIDNIRVLTGPKGDKGDPGEPGAAGPGVPTGGTAGQVLAKASGADYDAEWVDLDDGTTPVETHTVSGNVVTFTDDTPAPVDALTVTMTPAQSGSGDPSPTNIRPISGFTGANIHVSPTTDAADGTTYSVSWADVYDFSGSDDEKNDMYVSQGTLDVVNGTLTVDAILNVFDLVDSSTGTLYSMLWSLAVNAASVGTVGDYTRVSFSNRPGTDRSLYNLQSNTYSQKLCNMLPHEFNYALEAAHWYINAGTLLAYFPTSLVGSTAASVVAYLASIKDTNPLSILIPLVEPITYQLTAQEVRTILGTNNIWCDAGDVEVTYTTGGSGGADSALSTTSENPVQNKVVTAAINKIVDSLVLDDSYENVLAGASTFTDNTFISSDGEETTNSNFCLIDGFFPVKPNTSYKLYRGEPPLYSNAGHNWTWWTEDKEFISYALSGSAQTSPANAAYLRFGVYISSTGSATHATFDPTNVIITEDGNPCFDVKFTGSFVARPSCNGKKWIGVGDSITEENFRATYHYWDYIKAETGMEFTNMGVSGSGYMNEGSGSNAFWRRVQSMATDADVITIFGGVNDIVFSDADIGTASDTGTSTICGCVNTTLDNIEALYTACAPIGIISPLPADADSSLSPTNPTQNPNDDTCRMAVFVEQLALICKHRGIPFLDLFHESNLRPWSSDCKAKYFSCDSAASGDGVHPNGYGHRVIYRRILDFVQRIVMR